MSQFLPETGAGAPQTDSVGSLLTPATLDISSGDIALMQKVLAAAARNPNLIPSDFMAYIVDYIQTSRLSIPIGQVFGYTKAQVLTGEVNADGSIGRGDWFTVTKNGTGDYSVDFKTAFSAVPTILPTVALQAGASPTVFLLNGHPPTVSGFRVGTELSGSFADQGFNFYARPN